jgi:D-alanyl-lipoteichoic acid acyltransferase DltB (MBOAT superfamily)
MLFNSIDFALFLPLVFVVYWLLRRFPLVYQNTFVVLASYVFYGWWDYRFLALILLSTVVDFSIGLLLGKENKDLKKRIFLFLSILVNPGLLGFFKYYNFFVDNFVQVFSFFGSSINPSGLDIVLPVGISFYTFQTMSYTIDVYRKRLKPTKDFIAFSAYVSFFPQLVAGPIERASNLLPQFYEKRKFDYSSSIDGVRQILWGFFKKIVIADSCAPYVNLIFESHDQYSGSTLLVASFLFTLQIYGDFSGYSDIAIGTARLFGFKLMQNFAFPYFSRDIAEFWRRWHISLSTWFRDYLYVPLGGSRGGTWMRIRNIFLIFLVSGFWHGANWTFIAWGGLNAALFLPLMLSGRNRKNLEFERRRNNLPSLQEGIQMSITFLTVLLAWILFRSENLNQAIHFYGEIFSKSLFQTPEVFPSSVFIIIVIFFIIEWFGRFSQFAIQNFHSSNKFVNYLLFIFMTMFIYIFGNFDSEYEFIYFQF